MTANGGPPGIHVDDLGEPDVASPFSDDEQPSDSPQPEAPSITDGEAGHLLGELIGIPFALAGRVQSARAPQLVAGQVAEIWPLLPDEADLIGGRVWAAIPARFRDPGRRLLEASPAALAVGSLVQAIRLRLVATQLLVKWANAQEETSDPGDDPPQRAPRQAGSPAREPDVGGDRRPAAAGGGLDPGDDGAAGLGLSGLVQRGAAERRERRRAAEVAD